jgi:hypothetical protein
MISILLANRNFGDALYHTAADVHSTDEKIGVFRSVIHFK